MSDRLEYRELLRLMRGEHEADSAVTKTAFTDDEREALLELLAPAPAGDPAKLIAALPPRLNTVGPGPWLAVLRELAKG